MEPPRGLAIRVLHPVEVQTRAGINTRESHGISVAVTHSMGFGAWLADLPDGGRSLSLGASLRIIVDVLDALTEIHSLRGVGGEPLNLPYGEVAPANVLVGLDGVARLAHPIGAPGATPSS